MKLIFERSQAGRKLSLLPEVDPKSCQLPEKFRRAEHIRLPELSETEISRHYSALERRVFGVNQGFFPLGSCTMKYNPKINDELASLPSFTGVHPLQRSQEIQGCLKLLARLEERLCKLLAMDAMTFQPAAGAHGEFTALLMMKAYHLSRGDEKRNKILIPDAAHGTNPASAAMAGFKVVNVPSDAKGYVDLEALKSLVGEDTAGLMLTNPNTLGLFDPNIEAITETIHAAGGLNYYDGANLNPIMGQVRPGDMGFDLVHLNLHKTFSTPHGGGGPGSGPVGCVEILKPFLPQGQPIDCGDAYELANSSKSIGTVRSFYGNFLVVLRAFAYVELLGAEGIREASETAVLNANYLQEGMRAAGFQTAHEGACMHEFVLSLADLKKNYGVSALDFAKALQDEGMHPPTMYFPLIVSEALMVEPTETESPEMLDHVIEVFTRLRKLAETNPEALKSTPKTTVISRPDEVEAARHPIVQYQED
ncbi:MAG: aminomethyl-transferring glycine dehydrogenase subunit GcvPB [Eubacteriales bacterium]|nr:aminomethyl-transferring glycine dehydrogenase subunit GcvPB [Eubacteriales bacterium]